MKKAIASATVQTASLAVASSCIVTAFALGWWPFGSSSAHRALDLDSQALADWEAGWRPGDGIGNLQPASRDGSPPSDPRPRIEIAESFVRVELDDEAARAQLYNAMEMSLHGNPESAYSIFFDEWAAGEFVGLYPTESAFATVFDGELSPRCLESWAKWAELYMFDYAILEYPEWVARQEVAIGPYSVGEIIINPGSPAHTKHYAHELSLETRLGESMRLLESLIPAKHWPAFQDAVGRVGGDVLTLSHEERAGGFHKDIPGSVVHLLRQLSSCRRTLEFECGWTDPSER